MNAVLENRNDWQYSTCVPHKTGAGIGTPNIIRAHNRASAVFLCAKHCFIRIMVGRAGQPSGWPGSRMTGSSNPVRLTTHEIGTSGGELINLSYEGATMATTPTKKHPKSAIPQLSYDCRRKIQRAQDFAFWLHLYHYKESTEIAPHVICGLSYIADDIEDIDKELIALGLFDEAMGKRRK